MSSSPLKQISAWFAHALVAAWVEHGVRFHSQTNDAVTFLQYFLVVFKHFNNVLLILQWVFEQLFHSRLFIDLIHFNLCALRSLELIWISDGWSCDDSHRGLLFMKLKHSLFAFYTFCSIIILPSLFPALKLLINHQA